MFNLEESQLVLINENTVRLENNELIYDSALPSEAKGYLRNSSVKSSCEPDKLLSTDCEDVTDVSIKRVFTRSMTKRKNVGSSRELESGLLLGSQNSEVQNEQLNLTDSKLETDL